MVRISKERLGYEMLRRVSDLLITHILRMKTKRQAQQLVYELLTPAERIQLAKRFAIITMLQRGHATSTIENTLHVSRTTIGSIEESLDKGAYRATVEELKRASRGSLAVALEALIEFSFVKGGRKRLTHVKRTIDEGYRHIPKKK